MNQETEEKPLPEKKKNSYLFTVRFGQPKFLLSKKMLLYKVADLGKFKSFAKKTNQPSKQTKNQKNPNPDFT